MGRLSLPFFIRSVNVIMAETPIKKLLIYQYYRHVPDTGKTVNAGYNYHEFSSSSIMAYAKNIGVEYQFINHEIPVSPFYGIFLPFTEGWCHDYDAVCFIDSDILATVHAPSVFEHASKELISIHLMSTARPRGKNLSDVEYFINNGILNSGVVVFPRSSYESLIEHTKNLEDYHNSITSDHESIGSLDQAFMNLYIRDVAKTYHNLDKKFNYNLSRNSFSTRFTNYFVHYHRSFKRNIKEDFYNSSIIKGIAVNINNKEIYQPKAYVGSHREVYKDSKEYSSQKMLDHRMLRKTFQNENVLVRMRTDPYVIHNLFDESKLSDIVDSEYEFQDDVDQKTADSFYESLIEPIITDRISMYYETKPTTKKIPQKYVLLALHHQKPSITNSLSLSHNQKNIEMAKYAKLIASHLNLPLIVKPHPLTNDRNMLGYLMQDNFTIANNNICDLIGGAELVITSKSRVGLESIARLKKTILFGKTSYHEVCHVFTDINRVFEYASSHKLDEDYTKRYLFKYFTKFLGCDYVDDKA